VAEKKKTGLGTNAFFQRGQSGKDQEDAPVPAGQEGTETAKPAPPPKPKKVRTTVMMYEKTLASMELLKVEARKQGIKATLSDVLEEAIQSLMEKKKLELHKLE
jgi:hypothetical protein